MHNVPNIFAYNLKSKWEVFYSTQTLTVSPSQNYRYALCQWHTYLNFIFNCTSYVINFVEIIVINRYKTFWQVNNYQYNFRYNRHNLGIGAPT